jgi:hypothetical protein
LTGPGASNLAALALLAACAAAPAAGLHVYVGRLSDTSATLAWGYTRGNGNTIGRGAKPRGKAALNINGRSVIVTGKTWADIGGLSPDREYQYSVSLQGGEKVSGKLRTWPARAEKLTFFLIGDYGKGNVEQRRLGERMTRELQRSYPTGPPRFVLTTGDNIYGTQLGFMTINSGNRDSHWRSRFFQPFETILKSIPFYPTPGNHDGDESENTDDMDVYLDNFFFPGGEPARYYQFSYGGSVDLFALDSTENKGSDSSPPSPQTQWLSHALASSRAPWKIVYMHHPLYTAGPRHEPSLNRLRHWAELFQRHGVQAVFAGHEHNFQYTRQDGIAWFVSGAGGALREGDITGKLKDAAIEAWSAERHFLVVEMDADVMKVTPVAGSGPVEPRDAAGGAVKIPLTIRRAR